MAPESVSFRITRTAEDLAQTVSALSHRLVKLEQRLGALEAAVDGREQPEAAELEALANVETLLRDCRLLLEDPAESPLFPGEPALVSEDVLLEVDGENHGLIERPIHPYSEAA
jgi:DNA-binding transcriptional LysR family regulator